MPGDKLGRKVDLRAADWTGQRLKTDSVADSVFCIEAEGEKEHPTYSSDCCVKDKESDMKLAMVKSASSVVKPKSPEGLLRCVSW